MKKTKMHKIQIVYFQWHNRCIIPSISHVSFHCTCEIRKKYQLLNQSQNNQAKYTTDALLPTCQGEGYPESTRK